MRARTSFISIFILVLVVLIIIGSCATEKKAVKAPIEPLYGTWTNPDYNTVTKIAKLIFKPDGTFIEYNHTDITMYLGPYKYTIAESWMDSDGNKYYKVDIALGIRSWYELWRINETDTVLEFVRSNIECPTEIDLTDATYVIYYRQ